MRVPRPFLLTLSSLLCLVHVSVSLSSVAERSQLARSRLHEALSSPSGKLTLSPELIIDDPDDPTAILLQTSEIQQVSEIIRNEQSKCCLHFCKFHSSTNISYRTRKGARKLSWSSSSSILRRRGLFRGRFGTTK